MKKSSEFARKGGLRQIKKERQVSGSFSHPVIILPIPLLTSLLHSMQTRNLTIWSRILFGLLHRGRHIGFEVPTVRIFPVRAVLVHCDGEEHVVGPQNVLLTDISGCGNTKFQLGNTFHSWIWLGLMPISETLFMPNPFGNDVIK